MSFFKKDNSETNRKTIRKARNDLKIEKINAKNKWLQERIENIEKQQKSDPRNAWQNIKDLAKGLYGHHKKKVIKN